PPVGPPQPPGFPPQPMMSGGGYPPYGPPPQKSRTPVILAVVGSLVVIAIVVGIVIATKTGGGKPGTPGEAVRGYLEALARGDAEAALSYAADNPASKDFLTDEILKKQNDKWPISDIRILDDNATASMGTVHVTAKFGGQTSDETLFLEERDGEWKLKQGAIKLDIGQTRSYTEAASKTLTLFGRSIGDDSVVYVFPGWVDLGNGNKNITQKRNNDTPMLLNELRGFGIGTTLSLSFEVSDKGRSATQQALMDLLAQCAKSNRLAPPNCPQKAADPGLVDGTAAWTPPKDVNGVTLGFLDPKTVTARLFGSVEFGISVQTVEGGTKHGIATVYLSGTADLTSSPPKISV
ncbi:MAG: nuclear transport factor 2 family protein, partial [Mycobacterium sp.]